MHEKKPLSLDELNISAKLYLEYGYLKDKVTGLHDYLKKNTNKDIYKVIYHKHEMAQTSCFIFKEINPDIYGVTNDKTGEGEGEGITNLMLKDRQY